MNRLARGLLFSVIVHLVVVGAVCLLIGAGQPEGNLVEVDLAAVGFHDGKGGGGGMEGCGSNDHSPVPAMAGQQDSRDAATLSVGQPVSSQVSSDGKRPDIIQPEADLPATTLAGRLSQGTGNGAATGHGTGGLGGGTGSGIGSGSGTGDGAGSSTGGGGSVSHYVAANYSYILAHIQRQVVYPSQARMMGISGKAVYSFIIRQDGHIDSLSLVSSAGFDALDMAGLKAIRKASPFPAPPAPARIKVPIVFSLH